MRLYPALTPGGKGSPISRLKTVPTPVSDLCPPSHAGTAEATAWTSRAPRAERGPLPWGARPAAGGASSQPRRGHGTAPWEPGEPCGGDSQDAAEAALPARGSESGSPACRPEGRQSERNGRRGERPPTARPLTSPSCCDRDAFLP